MDNNKQKGDRGSPVLRAGFLWEKQAPTKLEIDAALLRLKGAITRTPLLENEGINEVLGGRVLFKCENLQVTGSFKARGVWNRLSMLTEKERAAGLICFSSGNHGHALAWAGQKIGTTVLVAMPNDAPASKIAKVKAYGGEVVLYDRLTQDRAVLVDDLSRRRGLTIIPAYDDRRIIAGAATVAAEAIEQAEALECPASLMIVGCGGGGLAAGCSIAWSQGENQGEFIIVEPQGYDDTKQSLASRQRVANKASPPTVCDALMASEPGLVTLPILMENVTDAVTVTDEAALTAVAHASMKLGLVVEPGGVTPLAALLSGVISLNGRTAIAVMSGGNIGPEMLARALTTTEGNS